jgi:hypothetical protein
MKTNGKHEVIAGIARQSLVLAALIATVLSVANISHAQSSGAAVPQPADAKAAQPAQVAASSPAAPVPKEPRGNREGIKIYGQWTIEVRNRDGSVAKHVEFENALDPSYGAYLLAGLLSGNLTPGPWGIQVYGVVSPCMNASSCFLVPPAAINMFYPSCFASPVAASSPSAQPFCYATLSYSLTGTNTEGVYSMFTLSGQAYVDTATSINYLSSFQNPCGSTSTTVAALSTSPSACLANSSFNPYAFTDYSFGSVGSCGGSGQPLCPVPVQAGQTVFATVQFSFSSASSSSSTSNVARPRSIPVKPLSGQPTGTRTPGVEPK